MNAQRFGRIASGLATAVVAVLFQVGCQSLPRPAVRGIIQSERAYRLARYDESKRLATGVIQAHPDKPDTAEAYYVRGLSRVRTNHRAEGRRDFQAAMRICGRNDLRSTLTAQLANMLMEDGRFTEASRLYETARTGQLSADRDHDLSFRYALSLERSGAFDRARREFARVASRRAGGKLASDASAHLAWKRPYFTVQCGAYSRVDLAQAAAKTLRQQGVDAAALRSDRSAQASYVIHAGRYRDYGAAQSALSAIRRVQPDAFVIP